MRTCQWLGTTLCGKLARPTQGATQHKPPARGRPQLGLVPLEMRSHKVGDDISFVAQSH
jgi:hypothetical protein